MGSAVVLIAEMGAFDLFSSPKKLYAYFGLDLAVKQSGKFNGTKVHMSKRGSSLAQRILHMIALNNLKVDKGTKLPINPVIYDYYSDKYTLFRLKKLPDRIAKIIFNFSYQWVY